MIGGAIEVQRPGSRSWPTRLEFGKKSVHSDDAGAIAVTTYSHGARGEIVWIAGVSGTAAAARRVLAERGARPKR